MFFAKAAKGQCPEGGPYELNVQNKYHSRTIFNHENPQPQAASVLL
jgi:hypothetical protein